jgi:hypothetical protein
VNGVTLPPGFEWVRNDRLTVAVRSDLRSWMVPLLRAAKGQWAAYATRAVTSGRGGALVVQAAGDHAVVVRPCRRGGLPARLLYDAYVGWRPRPFRELSVTETLRQRGAPVVEVYGAAVEWVWPGCYKGWVATRYMPGARTFWEWAAATPPAPERVAVLRQVGNAIRRLHDCGGRHPDLNLNNILVCPASAPSGAPAVLFIDFDRARMSAGWGRTPEADIERLRRSARKLDPEGKCVTADDLARVQIAYQEGAA